MNSKLCYAAPPSTTIKRTLFQGGIKLSTSYIKADCCTTYLVLGLEKRVTALFNINVNGPMVQTTLIALPLFWIYAKRLY